MTGSLLVAPGVGSAAPTATIQQVQAQLADLNAQAEAAQEQLNQAWVDVAAAQRGLAQARTKVDRSRAVVSAAQLQVGRLASALYRSGGVDQTVQVLLADNPSQFLEQVGALDSASRSQADALRTAAVAQQRLTQDQLAASQQLDQVRKLYAQANADVQRVKAALASRTTFLASLQAAQRVALQKAEVAARAKAAADARAAAAAVAAQLEQARAAAAAAAAAVAKNAISGAPSSSKPKPKPQPKPKPKPTFRPPPSTGGSGGSPGTGSASSIGRRVVAYALARVGDAYVWGAAGPRAYDCSGLTMRAYQSVGISLPHSSAAQYGYGRHVAASALQPGDLVFYYSPIHHVGIYIGGGMIVHAANPGEGVTTAPLYSMPFRGAVRPY
jgi:cell wall-associated NlpC family hydrolase